MIRKLVLREVGLSQGHRGLLGSWDITAFRMSKSPFCKVLKR